MLPEEEEEDEEEEIDVLKYSLTEELESNLTETHDKTTTTATTTRILNNNTIEERQDTSTLMRRGILTDPLVTELCN